MKPRTLRCVVMQGWAECLAPDGYPFPQGYGGLMPYDYDKLVGGLVDLHRYCGETQAIAHLSRITEWAAENLTGIEKRINEKHPNWFGVNGQSLTVAADALHWLRVRRTWRSGDRLIVSFPMALRLSRIDPKQDYPVAILYGPTVLAARSLGENPSRRFDYARLASSLVPVPGQPLNFHVASHPAVLLRPFYQFKTNERYCLYLDPVQNKLGNWFDNIRFGSNWTDSGEWRACDVPGAAAEFNFDGQGVRIFGYWFDDAGRGEVRIDGRVIGVINQYRPVRGVRTHWDFTGLAPGRHAVTLTVLAGPDPNSKGNHVNLAGFEPLASSGQ